MEYPIGLMLDDNMTDWQKIYTDAMEELYGNSLKDITEFADLCTKRGIVWYQCIFDDTNPEDGEAVRIVANNFYKKIRSKYKRVDSNKLKKEIGFFYMNYAPTTNYKAFERSYHKVEELKGRIKRLCTSMQKEYTTHKESRST